MKSFLYVAVACFFTLSVYSQNSNKDSIEEYAEKLSTSVSQELNFDDGERLYLYKALYAIEQTRRKTQGKPYSNPDELKSDNLKIDKTFERMLSVKFSDSEIVAINQLIAKAQ